MSNSASLITGKSHFISLAQAVEMTTVYRAEKENILSPAFKGKQTLPFCETFNREAFDRLLAEDGCVGLRFYYGMDELFNIHIIAVGVNAENENLLPKSDENLRSSSLSAEDHVIVEDSQRCPDDCPPPSPLGPS
jgi:hypothetical protein